MGQTHGDVSTRFQAASVTICSWAGSSQSSFYPPAIPLILLLIKQTCSQISLLTDTFYPWKRKHPARRLETYSIHRSHSPCPFLRSPYVVTFAHLYYLLHSHYLATYIGTTQIRIFAPVQLSLSLPLSLSRKPIRPGTRDTFRSNEPEPHPNGHCCYCGQRLPHQDEARKRIQVRDSGMVAI
jgi:hypothetical protein